MSMDEFESQFSLADELKIWIRGAYEDKMIAWAELGLLDTPPDDPFPMPNTCHPHYQGRAEWVRKNADPKKGRSINVVKPASVRDTMVDPSELLPTTVTCRTVLECKRYWAPMPFVGDAQLELAVYFWYAWVDDIGRHISTDSIIIRENRIS